MKVSDFFVGRLHDWGVRRIYGYLVTGINGVLGAWQRAGSIEFFQVRHEETASVMAVALAKCRRNRSLSAHRWSGSDPHEHRPVRRQT
jgi:thiamine pyrophosphate-dependent acetolactate synthase large subunit-like protein